VATATDRTLAARPPRKRSSTWAVIIVLSLSGVAVSLQQTLLVPLLPEFPAIFSVSVEDASWLVTVALLASAITTPIMARLADMFGKRRMMLLCLGAMTVGSVLGGVSTAFGVVVVARALQGVGAAMIPIAISIMRDELPREKVAGAVALMSATFGIGGALGLPLSGIIYEQLGWHAIFWISAASGVVLSVATYAAVNESTVRTKGRFDYVGAMLLSIALAALLLAISKGSSWGWLSQQVIVLFTITVVGFAMWVPLQLKAGQPLVDLRTSGRRPVLLTNIASFLIGFAMFANMLVTVQQIQLPAELGYGFGLPVVTAGLAMVPGGLAMVAFSPIAGQMITRYGGRFTLLVGSGAMGVVYILRIFTSENLAAVIVTSSLIAVTIAVAFSAMPTLIMSSVPITETASANGLNALVRAIGMSVSSASVAAVLAGATVQVGPVSLPALQAYQAIFAIAGFAALVAFVVSWYIPVIRRTGVPPVVGEPTSPDQVLDVTAAGESRGFVVVGTIRGRGVDGTSIAIHPAVITVMTLDGDPVDWSRVDRDGRFTVVIPAAGRYLALANAAGWRPRASTVEFTDETSRQDIVLYDQLCLSGRVRRGGAPVSGALVSLSAAAGGVVASVRSDDVGRYAIPLPTAGRYIVTALEPDTLTAHACKVVLDVQSVVVDFDVPDTVDAEDLAGDGSAAVTPAEPPGATAGSAGHSR
jgi:EmrB/QacA subfamily drug resistance transporter